MTNSAHKFYKQVVQKPLRASIYLGFQVVTSLFRAIGFQASRWMAGAIGSAAGTILPYERRLAMAHLEMAFPDVSTQIRNQIRRNMFRHFGLSAAELLHIEKSLSLTSVCGLQELKAAAARQGAIVVASHCGNWELLGAAVARANIPLTVIARRIYDPRLDRWMRDWRAQFDIETVVRDAPDAAKKMLRALRDKRVIVMLIDQDTDVPSVWVPFFGKLAKTPSGPARLAQRGTPVFKAGIRRLEDGSHCASLEHLQDLPDDIEAMTIRFSSELESTIRRNPGQWVWMHRRWKSAPPTAEDAPGP